ncbi:SAF domain-containing protein [Marinobacterium rhizophilum]|uniref:SAF domain-containing protein n=1 Tax=Marinobacterium rhizophilum TaxID=420402 RepID=A0ABY5HJB3_9GAMM|nr:hypothetical protein [Marinobacterium rhizophilum]UTW12044.1 hypothetical protein KDW95_22945 [Marinobacterium rhizophilum]
MKRKLTGSATAAVMVFVVSTALAGVLGVRQVERLSTQMAWVASGDLTPGQTISRDMLAQRRISNDLVGIDNPGEVLGKLLLRAKKDGDRFQAADLQAPPRSWLSQQVPVGRVLYTLSPRRGTIPHSQLRSGDVFDVLASGSSGVRTVARDVRLIGTLSPKAQTPAPTDGAFAALAQSTRSARTVDTRASLVVAVAPQDVYPLASISEREKVSLVLHGSNAAALDSPLSISPQPTHRQVEIVNGLSRKTVHVRL